MFSKSVVKTAATGLIALGMMASLSACGVRGPLKPPSAATNTQTMVQDPVEKQTAPDGAAPTATPTKSPDRHFFLDPLL
nr:lipoprotein [uncultured Cohaesibacter sp.]